MLEQTAQTDQVAAALVRAQSELTNPLFDAKNPHFGNQYVSLAAARAAILPVFQKHGLGVVQGLSTGELGPVIETALVHPESGQVLVVSSIEIPAAKKDAQGWGSAISYGRRYSLLVTAGVVGESDDDGNDASEVRQVAVAAVKNTKLPAGTNKR